MSETCMAWTHSSLGGSTVQQVQKMRSQRFAVGVDRDALAVSREVVPVEKHRRQRGEQRIGDSACARDVVIIGLRPHAAEHRDAGAQHIHGMRVRGQLVRAPALLRLGQAAQAEQAHFVGGQFRRSGQFAVDQQMRHFGKFAVRGQVGDVVSAIVQVVAGVADGADSGFARRRCRKAPRTFWV